MPCRTPNVGRPPTEFSKIKFFNHLPIDLKEEMIRKGEAQLLPCSQCIGCRLDNARRFALRSYHESSLYSENCFITLTYDSKNLLSSSLIPKHFVDFAKRLRKSYEGFDFVSHNGDLISPIRIMYAGEYGDKLGRPHFHACVYNFDFPDKWHWFTTDVGHKIYVSDTLNRLWGHGICTIGSVTFDSASYTARYLMKKITGKNANDYYQGRIPEFARHPRGWGLGKKWLERFWSDIYPHDYVVVMTDTDESFKMRPPVYYDRWLEVNKPLVYQEVKEKRLASLSDSSKEFSYDLLEKKEKKEQKRIRKLVRVLDSLN